VATDASSTLGLVLRAIAIAGVVYVALMSGMILLLATAPGFAARVRHTLAERREVTYLWGFCFLVAVVLAIYLLSQLGPAGFLGGLVLGGGALAVALMGGAALAVELGGKIGRLHGGHELTDLAALVVGGSVMIGSTLIPVFGWVLLGYFLSRGVEAVLRTLVSQVPVGTGYRRPGTV
jgi:hypothetical protein